MKRNVICSEIFHATMHERSTLSACLSLMESGNFRTCAVRNPTGCMCLNSLAERAPCYAFITSGVTRDHFSHSFSSSMCFADTRLFDDVYVLQTSIEHFQIWIPNMPRKIFKQSGCSGPRTVRQSMSGLDRTVALKSDCSHLGNLHHNRYIRAALLPVGMDCHR